MAVQVLGRGVEDQVVAQRERVEVHRARERVVDERHQALAPGEGRDLVQPGDAHQRVRDGLHQEELRLGSLRRGPGLGPGRIHERDAPAVARGVLREEVVCPAVEAILGEQVVPGREQRHERGGHRRHPRRGGEPGLGPLQRGQLVVEVDLGRRAVQPDVLQVVIRRPRRHGEHGPLVDGEDQRPLRPRPPLSRMHGQRLHPVARHAFLRSPRAPRGSPILAVCERSLAVVHAALFSGRRRGGGTRPSPRRCEPAGCRRPATGWFQVLPSRAGNRASSVNWSGVAPTSASSPSSESTSSTSWSGSSSSWPLP